MDTLILERANILQRKKLWVIPRVKLPPFVPKSQKRAPSSLNTAEEVSKELGKAQKAIDVARSRGISMREILQFDLITTNSLFDDDMTSNHTNRQS